ncbi:MAG: PaaI family thioesterase [Desulfomonile sp.]|jgi:acyl-coenzyme A thioesterase PaaI-like protein|nr:PaaI family thioesterase [Deltaproteobacteria bacterium]
MPEMIPLQDRLNAAAAIRHCYGCGADNPKGLRIKSFFEGGEGISTWRAQEHHCSYPGFLNGGVACTLIDCHCAWTAFASECSEKGLSIEDEPELPTGWTRAMQVEFLRPTPLDAELVLRARITNKGRTSRTVACSVYVEDQECVRAEVTIVMSGI